MLAALGDNAAPAIPELIAVLGDGHVVESAGLLFSRTVAQIASLALESIGPKAVPALADAMLTRPEKAIRIAAASTLVELLHKSGQKALILQVLDRAAADPEEAMRRIAVQGLGRMGPLAKPALVRLIEIVKGDPSEWVRFDAVTSLGLIDPRGERVTPHLTDALKDRSADVSWAAARSLGKLGPFAKSSVPALTAALDDPREHHLPLTPDFTGMRALRCDVADALRAHRYRGQRGDTCVAKGGRQGSQSRGASLRGHGTLADRSQGPRGGVGNHQGVGRQGRGNSGFGSSDRGTC